MKKLLFIAICGLMLTSCGNAVKNVDQTTDTPVETVLPIDTLTIDSIVVDSLQ